LVPSFRAADDGPAGFIRNGFGPHAPLGKSLLQAVNRALGLPAAAFDLRQCLTVQPMKIISARSIGWRLWRQKSISYGQHKGLAVVRQTRSAEIGKGRVGAWRTIVSKKHTHF
jgi:hypothetical protein